MQLDAIESEVGYMRILIANERRERLVELTGLANELGHEVVASEIDVQCIAAATERENPDVAIVDLGSSSEHALEIISEIVREALCPVIALLSTDNPNFVREASKRGVFACLTKSSPEDLQSALAITLERFTEYQNLQGAFARRAIIEQAKGILMARHGILATAAFEMLRDHSQNQSKKMSLIAESIIESNPLMPLSSASGGHA